MAGTAAEPLTLNTFEILDPYTFLQLAQYLKVCQCHTCTREKPDGIQSKILLPNFDDKIFDSTECIRTTTVIVLCTISTSLPFSIFDA